MPPSHFEEGVMTLPAITCIGTMIGTPVELSNKEIRISYVREIAKEEAFKPQREDFIQKVMEVVKNPNFPFVAPPRTESVVLDNDDGDPEDDFVFDELAAKALEMSSNSGSSGVSVAVVQTHVAGPGFVGGSEAVQAYVPSFGLDSNGSENILRNANQSISANGFSIYDCPTTSPDLEDWIESIKELKMLTPSVASDDDGYETSPILKIPQILRPCALTSSKIFGNLVERAVPSRSALGSSSDLPSVECAVNVKIRRVGD